MTGGSGTGTIITTPSGVAYCTYAEVKAVMADAIWGTSTDHDAILTALATRASRFVDRYTKRSNGAFCVGSVGQVRYFDGNGSEDLWVGELAAMPSIIEVAEGGDLSDLTPWAVTDVLGYPENAVAEGIPINQLKVDIINGTKTCWPAYPKAVKLTCLPGFSAVTPDEIKQAAIIQVARWFKRGQQGFQDAGASAELGQLQFAGGLDREVKQILDSPQFARMTI
jgi:hypothetical protein